ncbi:unnamed protein product [Trichobilharzia szidati]|nr:unnamed protein product [Trichobilharzia szidati]
MSEIVNRHTYSSIKDTINDALLFQPLQMTKHTVQSSTHESGIQCGNALNTEIDVYRRRIQSLLQFFDCISPMWWDRLYPFKGNFIKRPSRTAEDVRFHQKCLLSHLGKFNMRKVIPATAAISMMETHASIKDLPPNLLNPNDITNLDTTLTSENNATLLNKACNLAQNLADIEKLKQDLILSAVNWIMSDGRDYNLRIQRIALLERHSEPCLIENFPGVRALLTHYYRPRILINDYMNTTESDYPSSSSSVSHSEPLTAIKLTTTTEQILSMFRNARLKIPVQNPDNLIGSEVDYFNKSFNSTHNLFLSDITEKLDHHLENDGYITTQKDTLSNNFLLLNPLSSCIDTSRLEWLNYETNQKDFSLHLLNMEELKEREKTASIIKNGSDIDKTLPYDTDDKNQEFLVHKDVEIDWNKLKLTSSNDGDRQAFPPCSPISLLPTTTNENVDSLTYDSTKWEETSSHLSMNINYQDGLPSFTEKKQQTDQQQQQQLPETLLLNDYSLEKSYLTVGDLPKKSDESPVSGAGCGGSLTQAPSSTKSKGLSRLSDLLSLTTSTKVYDKEYTNTATTTTTTITTTPTTTDLTLNSFKTKLLKAENLTGQKERVEEPAILSSWLNNQRSKFFINDKRERKPFRTKVKSRSQIRKMHCPSDYHSKHYPI